VSDSGSTGVDNVPEAGPDASPGNLSDHGNRLWRTVVFLIKFLIGMVFCQAIFTSFMVIGWTYRIAQRTAIKYWCKCSTRNDFASFIQDDESSAGHGHWPNWFIAQNFRSLFRRQVNGGLGRHLWTIFKGFSLSLRHNLALGIQGAANTLALTLPSGMMWWFGWDYGWNISFYKSYEQSFIGPVVFLIGSLFFIAVMFYLPMAQARQAVCANWKSFWDARLIIRLIRSQWIRVLLFSGLFVLLCVPVLILKTAPSLFHLSESQNITTSAQAADYLGKYYFLASLYVFPCYVLIRVLAARIYARGLLTCLKGNLVSIEELNPSEQILFQRLELHLGSPALPGNRFLKIVGWMGSRMGQVFSVVVMFLVWAALAGAILVSEFLNYHEAGRGWLNQQLIQLPWFNYMPSHIRPAGEEISGTLILVVLVIAARYAGNCMRSMAKGR
tara:strand:+ start:603 stop:1928 length:1326 start_codon:yes stop_codon:yes gene_type:complete